MAKKLSTTRKGFAIGLAVVGIAGLSLASAAQLELTGPAAGTLQAGMTAVVNADCQTSTTPIKVAFSVPERTGTVYKSQSVVLTGIDAACVNKNFKAALLNSTPTAAQTLPTSTGVFAATATPPLTVTLDISALTISSLDSIKTVALTIYS